MFTIEQIKSAHSKVKSGADFPAYVKEIQQLGVISYETFVSDGHTNFFGSDNYKAEMPARYPELAINETPVAGQFKVDLKEHQQGKTDYLTFIGMCAEFGIEKWTVRTDKMTCTYYDKAGHEILVEDIPQKAG